MDLYFDRHDGEATTIETFLACFEDASGEDLTQFSLWYDQIGTPKITCDFNYDNKTKTATLKLAQSQTAPAIKTKQDPLHIPFRIALLDKSGHEVPMILDNGDKVKNRGLDFKKEKQTFKFTNLKTKPVPSLLRDFSAPVRLTSTLTEKELEFLAAHDTDPFNRWQAINTLATQTIVQIVNSLKKNKRSSRGKKLATALLLALDNQDIDDAFKAELLKLPSPTDIAREMETNIDYQLICKAHAQLSRTIGNTLGATLEACHDERKPTARFSPSASAAGQRALRNASLALLAARGTSSDFDRIFDQFKTASNMTDEAYALYLLAAQKNPHRQTALDEFYTRWHDDHIVIDTWFVVQAQSRRPEALDDVYALTNHPDFSLKSPNKARALIGNFVAGNPIAQMAPDTSFSPSKS